MDSYIYSSVDVLLLALERMDGWMAPCGVLWHASSVSVNYQGPKLKLSNYCEYYYLRSPKTEGECHRVPKVGQTVCNRAIRHWPTRRRRMLCGALYVRVVNSRSVLREEEGKEAPLEDAAEE